MIDDDDTIEFEIVQSDNTETKDIDENSTVQELKKVVNDNEQFHYLKSLLNDQNVKDTEIAQFVKVFNAENPDFLCFEPLLTDALMKTERTAIIHKPKKLPRKIFFLKNIPKIEHWVLISFSQNQVTLIDNFKWDQEKIEKRRKKLQ